MYFTFSKRKLYFFDHEIILSRGHSINSVNHHPTDLCEFQTFWNIQIIPIILESYIINSEHHFGIQKIWKHTQLHHFITLSSPRKLESIQIIRNQLEVISNIFGIISKIFGFISKMFGSISKIFEIISKKFGNFPNDLESFPKDLESFPKGLNHCKSFKPFNLMHLIPRGQGSQFFESCYVRNSYGYFLICPTFTPVLPNVQVPILCGWQNHIPTVGKLQE